jgi:cell division protein FtsW (lipid II flippase)
MIPHLWVKRVPWSVALIAESLMLLGWLGISRYTDLTGGGGRFLRQQVVWSLFATAVMVAVAIPNYRLLSRRSYVLFVAAVLLLVLVYLFPPINGARRWIRLGPLGFQPSELAKLAFVLALAKYLTDREPSRRPVGVLLPLGLALTPVLLILREPDLGTAMLFIPVLFWMLFVAGTRRRDLAWLALLAAVSLPLVWSQMSREQRSRVTAMFKQAGPGEPAGADTYQLRQAKQMMALGGAWGSLWTDPGVEDPAVHHLPEARSDFIFCVLVERLGLAGGAVVLGLYGVLVWRGLAIAAGTREPFGRLVAAGLTGMLAVQVVVNTAMNEGLLPVVGLSLPLVSYGGSGLMTQGALLGLILNVGLRPGYEVAGEPFRYVAQPSSAVRRPQSSPVTP